MSSYLPEKKTYAVCSSQLDSGYKTFIIHVDLRGEGRDTVRFKGASFVFLTEKDRKLKDEFSCKTCWSSGVGTIAFGAGVIAGLAVAATVATVPVIGWVVGGAIALGCLAYGLYELFSSLTCNQMLEYSESKWINPHQTVRFDTHLAVVKTSFIQCKEGGMILPFISETAAANAAEAIGRMNKIDMGLNVLGNFLSGGLLGFSMGYSGLLKAGQGIVLGVLGANIILNPLMKGERLGVRAIGGESMADDNPYYDKMIEQKPISLVPDLPQAPGDQQYGVADVPGSLRSIRELAIKEGATKVQIGEIDAAIKSADTNGGSLAGKNNPEAKIVFEKSRNGDYGSKVQEHFTNSKGDGRGMNRKENYDKATENKNQELKGATQERTIARTTNALNIITLILPFISVGLDEATLAVLAKAAHEDGNDCISVVAEKY